jgi:asparagine N-glycosylation enzyme membrane subunit Stt3
MKGIHYFLLVVLAGILVGILPDFFPASDPDHIRLIGLVIALTVYVPILAYLRMRTLGMSWKDYFLGLIPFYGWKYRFRRFMDK